VEKAGTAERKDLISQYFQLVKGFTSWISKGKLRIDVIGETLCHTSDEIDMSGVFKVEMIEW
jgi:hypothetical protein